MLTKSEPPPPEALMLFCVLSLSLTKRLKRSDMVGRHLRAVTRCPLAEVCTRSAKILWAGSASQCWQQHVLQANAAGWLLLS